MCWQLRDRYTQTIAVPDCVGCFAAGTDARTRLTGHASSLLMMQHPGDQAYNAVFSVCPTACAGAHRAH